MGKKPRQPKPSEADRIYWGADVPMGVIRGFTRAVADKFGPEKIILFVSHAYGIPHADSDVDVLVIMPTSNPGRQADKIRLAIPAPFPMDLIVRTPEDIDRRLAEGDLFHTEIVSKGKVLFDKGDPGVGDQGGGRLPRRRPFRQKSLPVQHPGLWEMIHKVASQHLLKPEGPQ